MLHLLKETQFSRCFTVKLKIYNEKYCVESLPLKNMLATKHQAIVLANLTAHSRPKKDTSITKFSLLSVRTEKWGVRSLWQDDINSDMTYFCGTEELSTTLDFGCARPEDWLDLCLCNVSLFTDDWMLACFGDVEKFVLESRCCPANLAALSASEIFLCAARISSKEALRPLTALRNEREWVCSRRQGEKKKILFLFSFWNHQMIYYFIHGM